MKTQFKGFRKYFRWMRCRRRILRMAAIEKAIRENYNAQMLEYYQQWYQHPDCSEWRIKT